MIWRFAFISQYLKDKEIFRTIGGIRGSSPVVQSREEIRVKYITRMIPKKKRPVGSFHSSLGLCFHGRDTATIDKLSEACRPKTPSQLLPRPLCVRKVVSPPPLIFQREKQRKSQEDKPIRYLSSRKKVFQPESESCLVPEIVKECPIENELVGDSCNRIWEDIL